MISIHDTASMRATLASPIDPTLHALLSMRMMQLSEHDTYDLRELAHFLVVEPSDDLAAIEAELGFPVATNMVDGCRYGDQGFEPSWEFVADHENLYEIVYIMSDDGWGHVLLVPDRDGIDPELLALCRCYAVKGTPTDQ